MSEPRLILVDDAGEPLLDQQQYAAVELMKQGERRIRTNLAKAVNEGRLFEVADWVRLHVGAEEDDLVYGVSADVLRQVEAWARFEAKPQSPGRSPAARIQGPGRLMADG